ncbi:hypothetical protein [Mesorhizobium sp. M0187]|uniref:hypothetical protein n=1 Tax=Mesorhizobium sp. M0187 TaxID=2956908 RepID=UPI00333CA586
MRFPPIDELLQQGGLNGAIDDLGRNLGALGRQHRREHRKAIACGYYLARMLQAVPDLWRDFCQRLEWNDKPSKPKLEDSARAIEFVFRISCGLDSTVGQKKASKLKFALLDAWEAEVSPVEISDWLKRQGGIEKAYKARRTRLAAAGEKSSIRRNPKPDTMPDDHGVAPPSTFQILASKEHLAAINMIKAPLFTWIYIRRSDEDPSKFEIDHVGKSDTLPWRKP